MANSHGNEAAYRTTEARAATSLSVVFVGMSVFGAIGRFFAWPGQPWVEVAWLTLGLSVTVVGLQRNLPLQNIVLAFVTLAVLGFAGNLAVEASKPGRHLHLGLATTTATALENCAQAAAWALLLLNAREVARLLATRRENSAFYGFWILGLAGALVGAFQGGLEATLNAPPKTTRALEGAAMVGWFCFAIVCLALASPSLLKRKPGPRVASIEPVWVWIGFNLLAMATAASREFWAVMVFLGVVTALGTLPAMRALATGGNRRY
jgi:hypothetical protein